MICGGVALFTIYQRRDTYLTQIRDVSLLQGEKVTHVFSPQNGLLEEPSSTGRLLITTSHRIVSFSNGQGNHETLLVPVEELKGVVVKSGTRNPNSLIQGLILVVSGLIIYFVLSYWITGHFDGPSVPIINIDLAPLIILLGLVFAGWMLGKHYFTSASGSVTFQGSNWVFTFPYTGEKASSEVHQLVKTVFTTRSSRNGYYPTGVP
jgi:hypothetical protein